MNPEEQQTQRIRNVVFALQTMVLREILHGQKLVRQHHRFVLAAVVAVLGNVEEAVHGVGTHEHGLVAKHEEQDLLHVGVAHQRLSLDQHMRARVEHVSPFLYEMRYSIRGCLHVAQRAHALPHRVVFEHRRVHVGQIGYPKNVQRRVVQLYAHHRQINDAHIDAANKHEAVQRYKLSCRPTQS